MLHFAEFPSHSFFFNFLHFFIVLIHLLVLTPLTISFIYLVINVYLKHLHCLLGFFNIFLITPHPTFVTTFFKTLNVFMDPRFTTNVSPKLLHFANSFLSPLHASRHKHIGCCIFTMHCSGCFHYHGTYL